MGQGGNYQFLLNNYADFGLVEVGEHRSDECSSQRDVNFGLYW